jgi:hypothetical protein
MIPNKFCQCYAGKITGRQKRLPVPKRKLFPEINSAPHILNYFLNETFYREKRQIPHLLLLLILQTYFNFEGYYSMLISEAKTRQGLRYFAVTTMQFSQVG